MAAHRPYRNWSVWRAQRQVPAIIRKFHLTDFKNRWNFSCWLSCSHFEHQNSVPFKSFEIGSEKSDSVNICNLLLLRLQIVNILSVICWHFNNNIEPRRIYKTPTRVHWNFNRTPEFPRIDSKYVNPPFVWSN